MYIASYLDGAADMGWTHIPEPRDKRKFFDDELSAGSGVVIDSVMRGNEYYAAVQDKVGTYGVVVVVEREGVRRGEIAYKVMEESEGPYFCKCPMHILKKLSPTTEPFALKWRRKCGLTT